ncbi:MAG: sugar nucleotide-binding protein [Rhodoferax sp.]|nr:sugar nucleotide-binding protein [Rhodoferax sp.]
MEVWGGLECTINRVNNQFFDQLEHTGHYDRMQDIKSFADLGIKTLRYPILWEKHQPQKNVEIDWELTERKLNQARSLNIEVIAGLVHHGSGPAYVHMLEETFVEGLALYAAKVAEKFPWISYYTPINEPLTTARFCGLYGIWYPHGKTDNTFCRILINQCKATVLAMQAIRKVNPKAKLVQTDDLGKIHSTLALEYQAVFENNRRWLSYDLLCGAVTKTHPLWQYLLSSEVTEQELLFFIENKCPPDIMGFNHYLTSERYLDEHLDVYPAHTHGGNGRHTYADVEAVRVGNICPDGPYKLLKEAWDRYHLPMAVTEVHLHCTREEQMRWLSLIWNNAIRLKNDGIDIRAITGWAFLGAFGWNNLLTQFPGDYEAGVFDLAGTAPRFTALAGMIKAYNTVGEYDHPVLKNAGWWQRKCRAIYGAEAFFNENAVNIKIQSILIIGSSICPRVKTFAIICEERGISYIISGEDTDIINSSRLEKLIMENTPWAIINITGFANIDEAEIKFNDCFAINTYGAKELAVLCNSYNIKLLTFSTDMVFNGIKTKPYLESDNKLPLNIYGKSKSLAEELVIRHNPGALIVRTSDLFGPCDNSNFITNALNSFKEGRTFTAISDVYISPTYLPDLVHASLNLLIDDEKGIWHLCNQGQTSWARLACVVAERLAVKTSRVIARPLHHFRFKAKRPYYSVLSSERGIVLPCLDDSLNSYLEKL